MFRLAVFIVVLLALAIGLAWFADNPGTVTLNWPWLNAYGIIEVTLLQAIVAIGAVIAVVMMTWWVISGVLHSPQAFGRWRSGRRRDKGYDALSRGLVAAGAGNAPLARRLAKESSKFLENEPLVEMLDAQTLLLEGKRDVARGKFESMLDEESTRLLGLRGLYIEAEREGETEAAAHFAREANKATPGTPWASQAVLKAQALGGEWEEAMRTLELSRSSGLHTKEDYNKKRAVLLTAQAMDEERTQPDAAKAHALAAHKLRPAFVPASVVAARLASRLGDMRKAARVLETTWKQEPHPELSDTYVHLRTGDSAIDRLKRAEALNQKRPNHVEGQFAIAKAALEAGEWAQARGAMERVLRTSATERACLMMADIEEAEHGDRGRVREWLARAVSAPRDAAWTADGIVSEEWKPFSPVSGRIDAFEWKVPVESIDGAAAVDYSNLANEPLPAPKDDDIEESPLVLAAVGTAATVDAALGEEEDGSRDETDAAGEVSQPTGDDVEDAEIVEDEPTEEKRAHDMEKAPEDMSVDETQAENEDVSEIASTVEAVKKEALSSASKIENGSSPFTNPNLDPDNDGVIDRRPDDPGIKSEEVQEKKGIFF